MVRRGRKEDEVREAAEGLAHCQARRGSSDKAPKPMQIQWVNERGAAMPLSRGVVVHSAWQRRQQQAHTTTPCRVRARRWRNGGSRQRRCHVPAAACSLPEDSSAHLPWRKRCLERQRTTCLAALASQASQARLKVGNARQQRRCCRCKVLQFFLGVCGSAGQCQQCLWRQWQLPSAQQPVWRGMLSPAVPPALQDFTAVPMSTAEDEWAIKRVHPPAARQQECNRQSDVGQLFCTTHVWRSSFKDALFRGWNG
ncbi:hypothetical protein ABPG75_011753 [Micractinium tetrahymenae]